MIQRCMVILLLAAVIGIGPAVSAPVATTASTTWQLDFTYQPPRPIEVRLPGEDRPQRFWYMLYTVSNHTGRDRTFMPQFTLYTDTGQVIPADRGISSVVFRAIKMLHRDNPLLVDMLAMTGKLLQGDDNAKDGVAIWPDIDPKSGGFDIFIGGLSGDTVTIELPVAIRVPEMGPDDTLHMVEKRTITLHKTLRLQYEVVGDAPHRSAEKVKLIDSGWVMR